MDIKFPIQFGTSSDADFLNKTWTFDMPEKFNVIAGDFALVPEEQYHRLIVIQSLIEGLSDDYIDNTFPVGGIDYPSSAEFPHRNKFIREGAKFIRDILINTSPENVIEQIKKLQGK